MKRVSSVLFAVAIAGCGGTSGGGGGGGGVDASAKAPDMAVTGTPDMAKAAAGPCIDGAPGCTGDPCTKDSDCAKGLGKNQTAKCIKSVTPMGGTAIVYDGGFCQTPCSPKNNDANNNYLDTLDCPGGNATCAGSGTTGACVTVCSAVTDCRDKYVCGFSAGGQNPNGVCEPLGASTCDPTGDPRPGNVKCGMNQKCVSYSPDSSYGSCADLCDPVLQDCAPATGYTAGCIVDFDGTDGKGECIGVEPGASEGDACVFLNGCAVGQMCSGGKCRQYCRAGGIKTDGGVGDAGVVGTCPGAQTCKNVTASGKTIKFTNATTGICSP